MYFNDDMILFVNVKYFFSFYPDSPTQLPSDPPPHFLHYLKPDQSMELKRAPG
jgi:hypothetical protein